MAPGARVDCALRRGRRGPAAHELVGVVSKRLDAPYRPGRRSHAWRKLKRRRQETLAISAWTPGDRQPDIFYLSRADASGEQRFAGAVQLGLDAPERAALQDLVRAREIGPRRRASLRPVHPGISLVVSGHGPSDRPLPDAVIHQVVVNAADSTQPLIRTAETDGYPQQDGR